MLNPQTLQQIVDRIVILANPNRVIVFGSYGPGDADEESDLDLMIIKPKVENKYDEMIRLHEAVGKVGVGVDVLVYSEDEFERRSQVPGTILYWARKEGKALSTQTMGRRASKNKGRIVLTPYSPSAPPANSPVPPSQTPAPNPATTPAPAPPRAPGAPG